MIYALIVTLRSDNICTVWYSAHHLPEYLEVIVIEFEYETSSKFLIWEWWRF